MFAATLVASGLDGTKVPMNVFLATLVASMSDGNITAFSGISPDGGKVPVNRSYE